VSPAEELSLSQRMAHLWAKSNGAPLLGHLLDVCRQAARFLRAYQPLWPLKDGAELDRILGYASLMHDFGKIHPAFQIALADKGKPFRNRHEVLSLAFLHWLEIPKSELTWLAATIVTHHKGWPEIEGRFQNAASENTDLGRLCRDVREEDAELLWRVLANAQSFFRDCEWPSFELYLLKPFNSLDYGSCIESTLDELRVFFRALNPRETRPFRPGARRTRDWRTTLAAIHTRGWMLSADHLASFGPCAIERKLTNRRDVDVLYSGFQWKPHQSEVGSHCGSALLIAPTGSGKTEAGLLWSARQAEAGAMGRVCILLPYQASLNAMQRRLIERLDPPEGDNPSRWNEVVGLLHGRAARHLYEAFLNADHAPASAERHARQQNDLARLFAAPVALSTIFSLIRLLFATRGAERLFATYSGARIVVDEIHAYTPEVTALALAMLAFLQEHLGVRVLFMSATVPPHLERALTGRLAAPRVPEQPPWGQTARHRLNFFPDHCLSERSVGAIVDAAAKGSVLVVVNQVRRAIQLREVLKELVPTQLLHSRFHLKDRAQIESSLGPKSGSVLVGTQAVEVSLDVDFDTCFTELAPIESLAQRFGRCNRKGLQPWPASVYMFTSFPEERGGHLPYDKAHLEQVRGVLANFLIGGARDLGDGDVHDLLARSYPRELQDTLTREISEKAARLRELFLDDWQPFGLATSAEKALLEKQWEDLFDGAEVLPASLLQAAKEADSWFGVARYLVPLSSQQLGRFRDRITKHEEFGCLVIDRPYGPSGLDLHSK
jgi:CRISPR-associated endonuclease/helicase Cas3